MEANANTVLYKGEPLLDHSELLDSIILLFLKDSSLYFCI